MTGFEGLLGWLPTFGALCGLGFAAIGIGVVLKRRWAQRELEALRKRYQETDVTDPEYNTVRALYFAAVADSHRLTAAKELDGAGDGAGGDAGGGDAGGGD